MIAVNIAVAATPESIEKQVQSAARTLLEDQAARAGLAEPLFDMTVVRSNKPLPACAGNVSVEPLDTRYPSRMRFAAVCPGEQGWRQEFVLRASISAQVLVAATDLPAGRPLSGNDLLLQRRDVSATPDAISDPQAATGLASKRALRNGEIVRRGQLAEALMVKRGDAVRIVARSGQIEVTVAGEAMEAGARGALVRVRNAGNGNVIQARVTGVGTVEPAEMESATRSPP